MRPILLVLPVCALLVACSEAPSVDPPLAVPDLSLPDSGGEKGAEALDGGAAEEQTTRDNGADAGAAAFDGDVANPDIGSPDLAVTTPDAGADQTPTGPTATLRFVDTFENGFDPDLDYVCSELEDHAGRFTISRTDSRSGLQSAKIFNQAAITCADGKRRAELKYQYGRFGGENFVEGTELWYGMSVRFPDARIKGIVWQSFAGGGSSCPADGPWWWFIMDGENQRMSLQYKWRSDCGKATPSSSTSFSVPTGRWVDLIHRTVLSKTGKGLHQVWIDGQSQPVVDLRGIDTGQFGGDQHVNLKAGIYYGVDNTRADMTAFFDNIAFAVGANGKSVVDPATVVP